MSHFRNKKYQTKTCPFSSLYHLSKQVAILTFVLVLLVLLDFTWALPVIWFKFSAKSKAELCDLIIWLLERLLFMSKKSNWFAFVLLLVLRDDVDDWGAAELPKNRPVFTLWVERLGWCSLVWILPVVSSIDCESFSHKSKWEGGDVGTFNLVLAILVYYEIKGTFWNK